MYEKIENSDGTIKELNYLVSPGGVFGILTIDEQGNQSISYLLKDHLNSITAVLDKYGNIVEEINYDAWGRHRNPQDWSYNNIPTSTLFDRGYTGHEHLDEFGLINMNGRVYDPFVARFLSPDPFIQNPNGRQGLNRYSYVSNNPMIYIDPSGYFMAPADAINLLWNSEYGGSWSNGSISYFNSHDQAFEAGVGYQNLHGSWANTDYGSEQASRDVYNFISSKSSYQPEVKLGILLGQHYVNYNYSTHKFYYVGTTQEIDIKRLLSGEGVASLQGDGLTGIPKSDAVSTLAGTSTIPVNTIKGGFDAARVTQKTVSTWSKGARVLARTSNILTAATVSYDFATGTANTSTLVNTGVAVVGAGVVFAVGIAAAPWVAAGGIVYGVVSLAGGDDWLNSKWDISGKINFVNPSGQ